MYDNEEGFLKDTLFIIVIYNCAITQSIAFQSLLKTGSSNHTKNIFIYDNSLTAQELPSANIFYRHNPINAGVSAAYNEGFRKAKQLKKKWLLLLDQDTDLSSDSLEKYRNQVSRYPERTVFAPVMMDGDQMISPFRLRWGKGIKIKSRQPGIQSLRHLCVINSGLLIYCQLFESADGYDERFPLDFSDLVFIERLFAITPGFILTDITLHHSLSSLQDKHTEITTVLDRFKKYCVTATLFKKVSSKKVVLSYLILPRAIKLSLLKKDIRFLSTALNILLFNR